MIAYRVEIWCSHVPCEESATGELTSWREGEAAFKWAATDIEKEMIGEGWTVVDGKHYCPAHKEKPE